MCGRDRTAGNASKSARSRLNVSFRSLCCPNGSVERVCRRSETRGRLDRVLLRAREKIRIQKTKLHIFRVKTRIRRRTGFPRAASKGYARFAVGPPRYTPALGQGLGRAG